MNGHFSFTQTTPNSGFNPPDQHQTAPTNEFRVQQNSGENEPKNDPLNSENEKVTFWTVCPYCFHMYEYEKKFEDCCLVCQNCRKTFHGMAVAAPPEQFLKGEVGGYHFGYGSFALGYSGDGGFFSDKKQTGEEGKHVVVEISDDSGDEKEVKSNGEGMKEKRVKSVPRNPKKMCGRGTKLTTDKANVVDIDDDILKLQVETDCESGENAGSTKVDSDFFDGIDEILEGMLGSKPNGE